MARIPDAALLDMIKTIPDPKHRQALGDVIAGRVDKRVKCLSKDCKGRVIAEMLKSGTVKMVISDDQVWLLSYRPRLDGFLGFQCLCGNDSRLAEAEKGVQGIEMNAIGRSDLEQIYTRNQKNKPSYPETDVGQEVDGFLLETVK